MNLWTLTIIAQFTVPNLGTGVPVMKAQAFDYGLQFTTKQACHRYAPTFLENDVAIGRDIIVYHAQCNRR